MLRILACVLFTAVALTHAQHPVSNSGLLKRIRDGDATEVERRLVAGADPNSRDEFGATALMHAAAFASPELVRLLLERGASIAAADVSGSTALMWGTHDPAIVRLLLDNGAPVNAARPDGMTAIVSAALRGRPDVMRMLTDAGADRHAGSVQAPWPMALPRIALTTNDPAIKEFLDRSEVTPSRLAGWTPPPFTAWLLTSTFSWRPQPAVSHDGIVRSLLDAGANANEIVGQLTLKLPALTRVVLTGDVDAVRVLLDRAADPNLTAGGGLTPLMAAALTEPDGRLVRLLLQRGAAVGARDDRGRTALDWALRLGETDATRALRAAGAVQMVRPPAPPDAIATPRDPVVAVEEALRRLQPAGRQFHEGTKCISCHHQSLPAVAVKLADAKGARIERALASHPTQATLEVWNRSRGAMLVGHCSVMGFLANAAYGLFGLAEEGVSPAPTTDAVTSCLAGLQKPDGSWESGDMRPPISARGPIVYTALAIRGLHAYAPPGRRNETSARLARALAFLRTADPADTQDSAFRLLGLVWGGGSRAEIAGERRRLLNLQRAGGGWGQLPTMPSDAYATGQALYALGVSGLATSSDDYRRGMQYLLRTQLTDGTWSVRSRAIGFQPYVETGFPHGPDQFVSAAATSWAVMGLSLGL